MRSEVEQLGGCVSWSVLLFLFPIISPAISSTAYPTVITRVFWVVFCVKVKRTVRGVALIKQ